MLTSRRRSRGFNLIELMVTISVLALLLGLAVPAASDWLHNTQVRSVAEAIQNGMQKARAEAIRRNRPVGFWLVTPVSGVPDSTCAASSSSPSWVISLDNPAGKCDVAASPTVAPRTVEVFGSKWSGINVAALAADGVTVASSITFNSFGQPVPGTTPIGLINISHQQSGARRLRIELSSGGAVRLCDRDASSPDPRACQLP
ncbi:GspH/FimT family pseudopilin [Ramlibacter sp. MMS24-I3-19]|uniref:GspH/FimT family pseudopilin n=1 Tax=Ramlibacter sp. MMS24-I3-19 TaxID=3416606 RepID=UPI003D062DE4